MANEEINVVNAVESAGPGKQLIEGIALSAIIIFFKQTTRVSLVTVLCVHVIHTVARAVVHTEINGELDALTPAIFLEVTTKYDTCA